MKINQYLYLNNSDIHHKGVFARRRIPKGVFLIEYIGIKLTKEESVKAEEFHIEQSKKDSTKGAVYMFELNDEYDIDGDVSYNPAKYINHSCNPNSQIVYMNGKILIASIESISKGEEISYNYGFDMEDYEKHPCRCGSKNCVGFILDKCHWNRIKKK